LAEAYVFEEGLAYFWTGGGGATSALVAYVQNVRVQASITYTAFKPPHATTYTQYPIASGATVSIGEAYCTPTLGKMFASATAGIHCHFMHSAANIGQTGGIFLYSGYLGAYSLTENPGGAIIEGLQGNFPTWQIY
jgi:hypothetical protein